MDDGFELGLDAIKQWCDANEVTYLENAELGQLAIPTPIGQQFAIRIIPRPERQMMTFALPLPVRIAPALRPEIARAAGLANSATFMGAWVLNHGKGELYFRITLPSDGVRYSGDALKRLLQIVAMSVRTLLPAWQQIIEHGAPADVILPQRQAPPAGEA